MSKYRPASLLVLSCIFGVALAACDGELPFSSEAMSGFSIHTKLLIAKNDDTSVDKNEFALSAFPAFRNKLQDFSFRLTDSFFAHHFNAGRENIAFSPLSTYMALAMLAECSASDTRQEVLDAFGMTYDEVLTQTDLLYRYSTKEFRSEVDNEIAAQQTLANSLWFDRSFPLKQSGLETLSDSYYCDSFETNFAHSPRASGQDFSYYVKEQTKGLIDKEYSFDSTTSFILSNVLYLKDVWNNSGSPLGTPFGDHSFTDIDGRKRFDIMSGHEISGRALQTDVYRAFYTKTNNFYRLYFIVPQDGHEISEIFSSETIDTVIHAQFQLNDPELKEYYETYCNFPIFEAKSDVHLENDLKADFGIQKAFDRNADFSSITNSNVWCSEVLHTTKLKVDRQGIEGAAVTVVDYVGGAAPDGSWTRVLEAFPVDRPFVYCLIDEYGIPVFVGTITH